MNPSDLAARGDGEGLWDWTLSTNRIHFSPRWMALVGAHEHEVGHTPEDWLGRVHPEDRDRVASGICSLMADGRCEFEIPHRLLHKDGTYRWMSCQGVVVRDEGGQAIRLMGAHADVTADVSVDLQTGLPNRLLFLERVSRSVDRARRSEGFHFAVLAVDLNRPRDSEAPSGPVVHDALLAAAARRLETCLCRHGAVGSANHDHLVARAQDDEFVLLLDGLESFADLRRVADPVLAELRAPFTVGAGEVFLRACIGVAVSGTGYTQARDALRDAETALHRARALGGARCEIFDTAVVDSADAERRLDAELVEALGRGEFVLLYQPIVSLPSRHVVGFEALVRWQHPVRGRIGPQEFIPRAEKTGFIVPLGTWVLGEACRQLKQWHDTQRLAPDVWVSVNVSSLQFSHPTLVQQVGGAIRDAALDPRCLVIELTEGTAMENPSAAKSVLMRLRVMGTRIALDDFGTGHASLAALHHLPADFLKLDRSFVRGMDTNTDMGEVVRAVTAMAAQLGLRVVAEGIETAEQLTSVHSLRCEFAQGFLFAKPLDPSSVADLLSTEFPPDSGREPPAQPERLVPPRPKTSRRFLTSTISIAAMLTLCAACFLAVVSQRRNNATLPIARPAVNPAVREQGPRGVVETPAPAPPLAHGSNLSLPAPPPTRSVRVVHRHVLGSCQGRLTTARERLTFVPDAAKDKPKDTFSLKYKEVSAVLSGDSLTIRARGRTYRFQPAAGSDPTQNRRQLQEVVDSITRVGRGVPAPAPLTTKSN